MKESGSLDKESYSPREVHTSRVIGRNFSDSDSNDSNDTRTANTESDVSVNSILSKQESLSDPKRPSPLLKPSLESQDSFMTKTMAWNSSSMDSEFGEFSDPSGVDQQGQLQKICETNMEYSTRLGHSWESTGSEDTVSRERTSAPAGDTDTVSERTVRASLASLPRDSDLGEDSSELNGSRSSPDLSGRGRDIM